MSVTLSPEPFLQFMNPNNSGSPAAGFKLFTYIGGTSTKQATWTDSTQTVQNSNPIVLDANGAWQVWGDPTLTYKFVLASPNDSDPPTSPIRTTDNFQFPITVNSGISVLAYPITQSEINAGITPTTLGFPELDIRRYGADPTGVLPSDTAMATAILVCGTSGATITVPHGTYIFANTINLDSKTSISIVGDGGANSSGSGPSILKYTATGTGNFIFAGSSTGCSLRNLWIVPQQVSYSGTMIMLGHGVPGTDTNFFSILDCSIGLDANVSCTHLDLDKSIIGTFERVNFNGGNVSVKGQSSLGGSYSNVMTFKLCQWATSAVAPIAYCGEAWSFVACTFEGVVAGASKIAGAVGTISQTPALALSFVGCWFGDVTIGGGIWITHFGEGLIVTGCRFGGSVTSANCYAISLNGSTGVSITGNTFDTFTSCVDFSLATIGAVVFTGNFYKGGATAPFTNGSNMPQNGIYNPNYPAFTLPSSIGKIAATGWEPGVNGTVDLWGTLTVTAGTAGGTGVVVNFGTNNGVALNNNVIGFGGALVAPANVANTWYLSTLNNVGFTVNVVGTGANVFAWRAKGF